MQKQKLVSTLLGLALVAGVAVAPNMSVAQDNSVRNQIIQVLELDQADVREALKILFKQVNASYTVSNEVQGTVTVHLKEVPFETALRNVLNQVDATYRVEGTVYTIIPKPTETLPTTGPETTTPANQAKPIVRIKIRNADPQMIALILAAQMDIGSQPEMSTMSGIGGGGGGFSGGGGGFSGGGFGGGGFSGGGFGGGGFSGGGFGGGGGFSGGGFGGGFGGGGFGGGGFSGGGGGGLGGGR